MVFSPPKRSQSLAYRRCRSRTNDTPKDTSCPPLLPDTNQQLQPLSTGIVRIEASRSTPDLSSPTDFSSKPTLDARDQGPIKHTNTTHPLPRVVTQIHPPTRSSSLSASAHTPLTAAVNLPQILNDFSQAMSPIDQIPSPASTHSTRPLKASKSESSACTEDYETADEFRTKSFEIPENPLDYHTLSDPPLSDQTLSHLPEPSLSPPQPGTENTSLLKRVDEDVRESLLEWKRKSGLRLDLGDLFSTKTSGEGGKGGGVWATGETIFGQLELDTNMAAKNNHQEDKEARTVAERLWREEDVSREKMTSYLGKIDPFHRQVLTYYLENFDFSGLKLDDAFRKLCAKLHFKAEAQEIDRVLEAFSIRYWSCNSNAFYGGKDVVYAIVYSIMLLNTDLHIVQGSGHVRMSRVDFCKNTMRTILDHVDQSKHTHHGQRRVQWQEDMEQCLKDLYNSVKQNGVLQPYAVEQKAERPKTTLLQRIGSRKQKPKRENSVKDPFKGQQGAPQTTYAMRPKNRQGPYLDDQLPVKKSLLRRPHKEWKSSWIVIDNGYLLLDMGYSDGARKGPRQSILRPLEDMFEQHDTSSRRSHGTEVLLSHCLATAIEHEGRNVMSVQVSAEVSYLVDCGNKDKLARWVDCCNYWAGRESKVPLRTGVSNAEYGWGRILEQNTDLDAVVLSDWKAPMPRLGENGLGEAAQMEAVGEYLFSLKESHSLHESYLGDIRKLNGSNPKYGQIMANWRAKKAYLEQETERYGAYSLAMASWQPSIPRLVLLNEDRPLSLGIDLWKEINQELQLTGNQPLLK
ncbi:hypothetical protein CLU79DRAFT_838008 [Phycomyces nitens]|nr:hypothetical protein CLU79DRAFT_838008 [Phycomyces nitens]